MKISNRRYIGCKTKLVDIIYSTVKKFGFGPGSTFVDLFAGTGVVGYKFLKNGYKVTFNDTLLSNVAAYEAFAGEGKISLKKINNLIKKYNSINENKLKENYFSKVYGDKYFSINNAKKIGYIRDLIEKEKNKLTNREYFYLITSLMYCCDKIANTVGHFESFLRTKPKNEVVKLEKLDIINDKHKSYIYNNDANLLSKKIKADIFYIDPPYNARQYVNFYHVLENLVRWNKPTEFEGNSMKFKRQELKSDYCRSKAPKLFEQLINSLKTKLIIVSYNNTYKAGSISSINTISEQQIKTILTKKGKLSILKIDFKAFNSGKTNLKNHKEYLYICEVKNE